MELNSLTYHVYEAADRSELIQPDLIIFYVADGQLTITSQDDVSRLSRGDILLINPGGGYEISGCRNALLGEADYPIQLLASALGKGQLLFYCNSAKDVSHSYQPLRDILFRLTAEYAAGKRKSECLLYGKLFELLDILVENFQVLPDQTPGQSTNDDDRMRSIMSYVLSNLDKTISLNQLAEEMYVSTSTLSRIFRKNTGVYFVDYVNTLRVQMAMELIGHTDQNMTKIAMSCGFMNSASFNRAFRKVTGTTPSEYRELCRKNAKKDRDASGGDDLKVRTRLQGSGYLEEQQKQIRGILVDLQQEKPPEYRNIWDKVINIGPIWDLTNANVQYHTLYLSEQLHFRYVRVWNLFSRRMMLTDDRVPGVYNYTMVDQALDFLVSNKLIPFIDFGRRPDTAIDSTGQTLFYDEQYLSFPSRESWTDLVEDFLSHVIERYSRDLVSTWIFELSRDDQHGIALYNDPGFDYFDAFSYFYRSVKAQLPRASFGGLGDIALKDWNYILRLLQRCREHSIQPDFISLGLFGHEDFSSAAGTDQDRNPSSDEPELAQILKMRQMLAQTGFPEMKLYVTEWNNTVSNRNYLNDSCYRAAYLVKKAAVISSYADLVSIMSGTDWVSNYVDSVGIADGGIGLLTKDMIRKPAFYAVRFLNGLGKYLLGTGDYHIATRDERGDLCILLFNYTWTRRDAYLGSPKAALPQYGAMTFTKESPVILELVIRHLDAPGEYILRRETMSRENGSILEEWGKFDYDLRLRRDDVKYLQSVSIPTLSMRRENVTDADAGLTIRITLEPNEISLLHISRRK